MSKTFFKQGLNHRTLNDKTQLTLMGFMQVSTLVEQGRATSLNSGPTASAHCLAL